MLHLDGATIASIGRGWGRMIDLIINTNVESVREPKLFHAVSGDHWPYIFTVGGVLGGDDIVRTIPDYANTD